MHVFYLVVFHDFSEVKVTNIKYKFKKFLHKQPNLFTWPDDHRLGLQVEMVLRPDLEFSWDLDHILGCERQEVIRKYTGNTTWKGVRMAYEGKCIVRLPDYYWDKCSLNFPDSNHTRNKKHALKDKIKFQFEHESLFTRSMGAVPTFLSEVQTLAPIF